MTWLHFKSPFTPLLHCSSSTGLLSLLIFIIFCSVCAAISLSKFSILIITDQVCLKLLGTKVLRYSVFSLSDLISWLCSKANINEIELLILCKLRKQLAGVISEDISWDSFHISASLSIK